MPNETEARPKVWDEKYGVPSGQPEHQSEAAKKRALARLEEENSLDDQGLS